MTDRTPRGPTLIVITGPPGSGKTTLAKRLARDLGLPLVTKDDIKEILYDVLGWSDREWSMKLGHASMEILFYQLEVLMKAGNSMITETAFIPEFHTERLVKLRDRYNYEATQVYCTADGATLLRRIMGRATSGERHPGHVDHTVTSEQVRRNLDEGKYGVLQIGGDLLRVDTTDFEALDYDGLVGTLRSAASGGGSREEA